MFVGNWFDYNDCFCDIEVGINGEIYLVCLDNCLDNFVFFLGIGFVFSMFGIIDIGVFGFLIGGVLLVNFVFNDLYNL